MAKEDLDATKDALHLILQGISCKDMVFSLLIKTLVDNLPEFLNYTIILNCLQVDWRTQYI